MKSFLYLTGLVFTLLLTNCSQSQTNNAKFPEPEKVSEDAGFPMKYSDKQWREMLTPQQYYILRQEGTERSYSGKLDHFYKKGTYYSAASLQPVFSSETKFNSGTGWPSFYAPISKDAVKLVRDQSLGVTRWEVVDSKSGSHLGHIFDDGPAPTGKRYCLNSDALIFVPEGGQPPARGK